MNQELIEQGNEFYLNGNYNEALDCYFKHLFQNEPSAELFMKIGHCNKMMNDNENAIEYYIKSLELEPENLEALFNCAESYTHINDMENSIEMFEKLISVCKNQESEIAEIAKTKMNESKAILLQREGGALMKEGLFDEAYNMFKNAIELYPSDKRNYVNIGVIYLKKGEPEKATKWIEKAIEIDPKYVRGYYNLGTIYLNLGKDKKAISTLEKALEIEPEGRDSEDIQTNLDVAKERFEISETEILSYLKNEKIEINNENIIVLSNSVIEEKIGNIDFAIFKSGKMKIIAYSENGNFEITENKGKVVIRKI